MLTYNDAENIIKEKGDCGIHGVKSCMNCGFPHHRKNYDKITSRFQEIVDVMAASNKEEASDEM